MVAVAAARQRDPALVRYARRRSDLTLAFVMGGGVALLLLALPLQAALASAAVAAFVVLALVDTRVALLALLLVRSTIDVTADVAILGGGESAVNAAAMMSLLVVGIGVAHIATQRTDVWGMPLAKPFLFFLAVALAGVVLAPDANRAMQDWMRAAGAFIVYVLVVDLMRTRDDLMWMLRVLVLSSLIPITVGMVQWFTDTGDKGTDGFNRIFATFTHPSPYGFYLVSLVPLAMAFWMHTQSKLARVGLTALIPLMLFSIYATQTRGAWIGVAVVLTIFLATRARWMVLFVPLAAAALIFAMPSVQARFSEAGSATGSVLWRQRQWERAIDVASPVQLVTAGAGLGAVDVELGEFTHNEYVRLLVETGAIGLAATLVLYRGLFVSGLREYRRAATPFERDLMLAFLLALISRAVIAAADNVIVFPVLEWYFWGFAGVVVAMGVDRERRSSLAQGISPTARREAA